VERIALEWVLSLLSPSRLFVSGSEQDPKRAALM